MSFPLTSPLQTTGPSKVVHVAGIESHVKPPSKVVHVAGIESHVKPPSKVVHVTGVESHVTESYLNLIFRIFGAIAFDLFIYYKSQQKIIIFSCQGQALDYTSILKHSFLENLHDYSIILACCQGMSRWSKTEILF